MYDSTILFWKKLYKFWCVCRQPYEHNYACVCPSQVNMAVYATYLRAVGLVPCLCVLLLCLVSRAMGVTSSVWLVKWSDYMTGQPDTSVQAPGRDMADNSSYGVHYNSSSEATPHADKQTYYISGYAIFGSVQGRHHPIIVYGLWW